MWFIHCCPSLWMNEWQMKDQQHLCARCSATYIVLFQTKAISMQDSDTLLSNLTELTSVCIMHMMLSVAIEDYVLVTQKKDKKPLGISDLWVKLFSYHFHHHTSEWMIDIYCICIRWSQTSDGRMRVDQSIETTNERMKTLRYINYLKDEKKRIISDTVWLLSQ